jgi:hypothetical protein
VFVAITEVKLNHTINQKINNSHLGPFTLPGCLGRALKHLYPLRGTQMNQKLFETPLMKCNLKGRIEVVSGHTHKANQI